MISRIFIDRPRLAMVVSLVILLAGFMAMFNIPVAQYPQITPPEVRVSATYPGANADVVADSVAAPIESQVNGVENMLYMSSTCSNDGSYSLTISFEVGTDPDIAQVNVLNRVQQAQSKLPSEVTSQGITVRNRASNMLGIINFYSPNKTRDELFLHNYISRGIKDAMSRVDGVSEATIFGDLDYSMRIWLDPERLAALGLTAEDVVTAIENQNIQAAAGSLGSAPAGKDQKLQYTLRAKGRLTKASEFKQIIIRTNKQGGILRLSDVARVELGALSYAAKNSLNGAPSVGMAVYQTSGSNALDTMKGVVAELNRLSQRFPEDVAYAVNYDSTVFVQATIAEIVFTLFLTFVLVVGVTFLFLQDWRATLIPTLTIPVALVGTFAVLLVLGYSANILTLFALILAIGLVVDDAIVVVENVQRIIQEEHLPPREAAIKAMGQVTGPIVATTLVLLAVFVPVGFMPGITGQLYQQFAVTICVSVVLSAVNALSLSPALCSLLLRTRKPIKVGPLAWFTTTLYASRQAYVAGSAWLIRRTLVTLGLLGIVLVGCYFFFITRPTSFLPSEDQGVIFFNVQLPDAASLGRTVEVTEQVYGKLKGIAGLKSIMFVNGFSMLSGNGENQALGVATLKPWDERTSPELQLDSMLRHIRGELSTIPSASILAFVPPAISGMGVVGGFDFRLQGVEDQTPREMAAVAQGLALAASQDPNILTAYTTYSANVPQIFVDLDRAKAQTLGVPVSRVFSALQSQMGSRYVNDFNLYSRVYQVKVQAQYQYRDQVEDVSRLYVRNDEGNMVPLSTLVKLTTVLGPQSIYRYNQFPAVQINGEAAPGSSSGQAIAAMEKLAHKTLPQGYGFDWSGMSYQEKQTSGESIMLLALALLFGYLFLVGQYESWTIPVPVILSISVAALGALLGLWVTGLDLSIYAQIGLVLLVGLASKNAILIVEFAKTRREEGAGVEEAALAGAQLRYRAVLMTAFSFILGVLPMVIATGAGAASRRAIGTTVFAGMIMATVAGIFLIPALYTIFERLRTSVKAKWGASDPGAAPPSGS